MQQALVVILLALIIAVGYSPDGSLAALFAVLGLLTALAITGTAKFLRRR